MSGESVALVVAMMWTVSAIVSEIGCRRMGVTVVNVWRMVFALTILGFILFFKDGLWVLGSAGGESWLWLLLSGAVGYTFGDFCLFNAYASIGSRFAQLFMTLAPVAAAVVAWLALGETVGALAAIGMFLTLFGIGMSVMGRSQGDDGKRHVGLRLPLRGVLFAVGAAVGQGVGLVLSKVGMSSLPPVEDAAVVPLAGTFIRGLAGLVGFVGMLFVQGRQREVGVIGDWRNALTVMCMAFFGPGVGVALSLRAVQLTDVGVAQTIMALTPVLILFPSYFLFRQKLTPREVVGAVVSFVGVAILMQ